MNESKFITQDEWDRITEKNRQIIADAIRRENVDKQIFREIELPNSFYVKFGKRTLDIILGGFACIVFLVVNLIIAVITYFDVGYPIIFRQERVGKNGKLFSLVKFRNMTNEKNEQGILLPPDQRVTRWGRFVRRTSLDELLNFWSILKGDMSIIGPRPLPKKYVNRFSKYHQQRHLVRPGLECPYHERSLAEKGWAGRFENDIWYIEHLSFKTDVWMAILLIKKVFSKEERAASASGKTGEFIGYSEDGAVMNEWMIPRKYLKVIANPSMNVKAADEKTA